MAICEEKLQTSSFISFEIVKIGVYPMSTNPIASHNPQPDTKPQTDNNSHETDNNLHSDQKLNSRTQNLKNL